MRDAQAGLASADFAAGPGAVAVLDEMARRVSGRGRRTRTVLVVGEHFADRAWAQRLRSVTASLSPTVHRHTGGTNPESVAHLTRILRESRADVVLAAGGGAVLDVAKAATRLGSCDALTPSDVVLACAGGLEIPPSVARVVAVPSTPGTGAEVTPFATVWHPAQDRKLSLGGPGVTPAAVILDPDLLAGLSPAALLSNVLDTLCQGAEAAWSVRATAASTSAGLAAIALAVTVVDRLGPPLSLADRLTLQIAGHLSGQAIAIAQTSSCHAISYPLTLRLGMAHGHACGVSLGRMLRYNAATTAEDCRDPRGSQRVRDVVGQITAALGAADPGAAADRLDQLLVRHGLSRYEDLAIDPRELAQAALRYERCQDNPRALDPTLLTQVLAMRPGREDSCP